MTYHFVNLVSWRFFLNKQSFGRVINLDSVSIHFLSKLFGYNLGKLSGVTFYNSSDFHDSSTLYMSAKEMGFKNEIILPFWKSLDEVNIGFLEDEIYSFKKVVLGVSSPKQDKLAELLMDSRKFSDDVEIYCLGAAIYLEKSHIAESRSVHWLSFLLSDPLRTVYKLRMTVVELIKILFLKKDREKFKLFLDLI
jgi:hypothetical protein